MKRTQPKLPTCAQALLLATLPLAIGQALAATQLLRADKFSLSLPGGSVVQMWGYAGDNGACNTGPVYPAWTPGPAIVVFPGEGLTVTLKNCLDEATSLVVPGQVKDAMAPVWFEPSAPATTYSGARPAGNTTARVRSFDLEAPAGGSQIYTWTAIKPGTYLYQSGTHPQVQVQMGLYGSLTKDADAGNVAYRQGATDIAYSNQVTLLYSEIDPVLHNAVSSGTYGPCPIATPNCGNVTSTLEYHPKYFLINGLPFDATANPGPVATVPANQNALLRFLNASLKTHVPTLNGQYWKMIAEDGNPYPYLSNPRQQYTAFLAPGKTMDVLLTPSNPGATNVRYQIFDSRQFDTNNGVQGGGMLAFLDVTPAAATAAPVFDSAPLTTATAGVAYSYAAHATDPNGDTVSYSLNAPIQAGMTIDAGSGLIAWTPTVAGTYPVSVRASDTTLPTPLFSDQAFSIAVAPGVAPNQPPTARNDSYTAVRHPLASGLAQVVAAPGVLGNDTDPDGNALTAIKLAGGSNAGRVTLNSDGSFSLAPLGGGAGNGNTVVVNYQANDGAGSTGNATLTILFVANRRPVAVADAFTVPRCTTGTGNACLTGAPNYVPLALNLANNDTDLDTQTIDVANQLPLAVARVRAQTSGNNAGSTAAITTRAGASVTISGGTVIYTPRRNFAGTDLFQYRVKDKLGLESGDGSPGTGSQGWVTVTVTVQ